MVFRPCPRWRTSLVKCLPFLRRDCRPRAGASRTGRLRGYSQCPLEGFAIKRKDVVTEVTSPAGPDTVFLLQSQIANRQSQIDGHVENGGGRTSDRFPSPVRPGSGSKGLLSGRSHRPATPSERRECRTRAGRSASVAV